jgi:hypothetical protein
MTKEEENEHKRQLLLEREEQRHQLKVLEGPMRDWGRRLGGLSFRLGKEALMPGDLETVSRLGTLPALIAEYEKVRERVVELNERYRKIFGE